jgi:hypothetical protein
MGLFWRKKNKTLRGTLYAEVLLVTADVLFGELKLYNVAAQYFKIATFQN